MFRNKVKHKYKKRSILISSIFTLFALFISSLFGLFGFVICTNENLSNMVFQKKSNLVKNSLTLKNSREKERGKNSSLESVEDDWNKIKDKLPKLTLSNNLHIQELGYRFPWISTYKNSNPYPYESISKWLIQDTKMKNGSGFFINFYDDKKWWPDNVYSDENQIENEGYFSFGESEPVPIKEKLQNDSTNIAISNNNVVEQDGKIIDYLPIYDAIFKLYSEKNKKWVWSDSDLFDIRYELFKVRNSMITDWWAQDNYGNSYELEYNYFYLWFVQTGTKVVYEPKTTTNNVPNYPPISNKDPSQWPENWFEEWSNSWNKKYVVSNNSTVKFLGLTQDNYTSGLEKGGVWSTYIEPKVIDKGNTKNIEYIPYYSKEPIKNVDKTPPKKEDYNFEQGMAFFIKIPKWCSFVVDNQNVTESEDDVIDLKTLFEWFKNPPSIENGSDGSGSSGGNIGGEIETPIPEPTPEQPEPNPNPDPQPTPNPEPNPVPPTDGDNNSGDGNIDENKPEIDIGGSQQPTLPPVTKPEPIPPISGDGEIINPIDPPENGGNNDSNSSDNKNNNLANNNQNSTVGIIVGITIGVGLLFSLISLYWFVKKKKNKN